MEANQPPLSLGGQLDVLKPRHQILFLLLPNSMVQKCDKEMTGFVIQKACLNKKCCFISSRNLKYWITTMCKNNWLCIERRGNQPPKEITAYSCLLQQYSQHLSVLPFHHCGRYLQKKWLKEEGCSLTDEQRCNNSQ